MALHVAPVEKLRRLDGERRDGECGGWVLGREQAQGGGTHVARVASTTEMVAPESEFLACWQVAPLRP